MGTEFEIGILTGAGPEAGIDLWQKVLERCRALLGERFRGDIDAPSVLVVSDPRLGEGMDLSTPARRSAVAGWVAEGAARLDPQCAMWAIACNTLNLFGAELRDQGLGDHLLTYPEVAIDHVDQHHGSGATLTVLGARPVAELGEESAYRDIGHRCTPVGDEDIAALHDLILDAKRLGVDHPTLPDRLAPIVERAEGDVVLLACTELPPIAGTLGDPRGVDVTRLVADRLAGDAVSRRSE